MGYSCFPATSASKHSCSKSAEPQPHLISYPTKKCSLVCPSSFPPCIFSKSSTHTKGWKAALLYSHSSTCLCSLAQRCISDINLLNISSLQAAESSGGRHAAEDQEGWCTKGANSPPPCQLLTAPQDGASSAAPQRRGIAQQLPLLL